MEKEIVEAHRLLHLGAFTLHLDTLVMIWVVMGILILFAFAATRRMSKVPRGFQNILEIATEFLDSVISENAPPLAQHAFPVVSTLFLFTLVSNLLGLIPGLKTPTSDINVPLALATVVFSLTVVYGVKAKGLWGYIKSYFHPNILFLPLNIIEQVTRVITLAFRLFGNMFAGDVLIVILGRLMRFGGPVFGQAFHVFVSVLQAYLFLMLAVAYIAAAVEE